MNIRSIKNKLRAKLWTLLKANWKLRSDLDITIENDSDWFVYNEIFVNKEYDRALELFFDTNPVNPLILDLGANVGYFTLKIADELIQRNVAKFKIISLEASPFNFGVLRVRLGQKLLKERIEPILGLAGFKNGVQVVKHSDQHYGHSTTASKNIKRKAINVNYVDIDSLLPNSTDKIDFLKCDIEGSEEIFLKEYSSLLRRVEFSVFEFHAEECNITECRRMLQEAGLVSRGIIGGQTIYRTTVEIFSRQ